MDRSAAPSTRWLSVPLILALLFTSILGAPNPDAQAADGDGHSLAEPSDVADTSTVATTSRLVVRPPAVRGLANAASRTDALAQVAGVIDVEELFDGLVVLELDQELTLDRAAELADELVADDLAAHAEPDPPTTIAREPNDPLWEYQWGPRSRGLPSAWDVTVGGNQQPIVAVLDTGVSPTNELSGRLLPGYNALDGGTDTTDGNGHGTQSATVIAARGDDGVGMTGQCWDCQILPVKVLNDAGNGSMSHMAAGIGWAVDNGADIINISAGGPDAWSTLETAVRYADDNGVLIVASAGNGGDTAVLYPAAYTRALSVAGSQFDGSRYEWSTYGPGVDVAAPGCNVAQRPDSLHYMYCGTSSAAPFVTGLLALALDVQASLSPAQLRARARDTSESVSYVSAGIVSGPGIVPGGAAYEDPYEGGEDGDPDALPGVGLDPVAAVSLHAPTRGDLRISLSWSATSGGTGTGYRYQVRRTTGSTCNLSAPRLTTTQNRSYTDRAVGHGMTYRYCVYALDGDGNRSARSNVRSVTAQDTSPPPAPSLGAPSSMDGEVRLSWSGVTDPTGPITYRVHRADAGSCSARSPVVGSTRRTDFTDASTTVGRTYRYCLTARDGAGNTSAVSNSRDVRTSGCYALTGDWNGAGREGIGWWCDGRVRLRAANRQLISFNYGRAGDVPVAGDWNGDGRDTLGIIRDGRWHLRNSLGGGPADVTFTYGRVSKGDNPVVGDWNGSGRDGIGIIRGGTWHLRNRLSGGAADATFTYGQLTQGDLPLVGDWRGRGSDRIGIVRSGRWHLRYSLSGGASDQVFTYGRVLAGDLPVIGDWTGNGRPGVGIVRGDTWHLRDTTTGGSADRTVTLAQP